MEAHCFGLLGFASIHVYLKALFRAIQGPIYYSMFEDSGANKSYQDALRVACESGGIEHVGHRES